MITITRLNEVAEAMEYAARKVGATRQEIRAASAALALKTNEAVNPQRAQPNVLAFRRRVSA